MSVLIKTYSKFLNQHHHHHTKCIQPSCKYSKLETIKGVLLLRRKWLMWLCDLFRFVCWRKLHAYSFKNTARHFNTSSVTRDKAQNNNYYYYNRGRLTQHLDIVCSISLHSQVEKERLSLLAEWLAWQFSVTFWRMMQMWRLVEVRSRQGIASWYVPCAC